METHSGDEPSLAFQLTRPGTDAYDPSDRSVEQRLEVIVVFAELR